MPVYIPLEIIAIEDDGFHLMTEVSLNGHTARLLLDTGASRTAFDKNRIGHFFREKEPEFVDNEKPSTGLGSSDMQSMAVYIGEMAIGALIIKNYPAVVIDMGHVNSSYQSLGFQPIDGVLGSDILMKYGALIDYGKARMRINLRRKSMKKVPKG
jgi:hypothetical protein